MDEKSLEFHIDEPIKKCVVGMALLGFIPAMSCCGFEYKDEKVKKCHLLDKPYIYLMADMAVTQKIGLLDLARISRWTIKYHQGEDSTFVDFFANTWEGGHPWKVEGCPHRYESSVLAIRDLERGLSRFKQYFLTSVDIIDGNSFYKDKLGIKYWQYEPGSPWTVTPEIFESL